MKPRLSIILPCFNEAANLPLLLNAYRDSWEDLPAELILVDNGSTDQSTTILSQELARPELNFVRVIRVDHNQGYGYGLYTGLQAAQGEFIGFSHADMQYAPAVVFEAYHKLMTHPNPQQALVKGKRSQRDFKASLITNGMSLIASTVLTTKLTDINAQPKLFHCSHLKRLTNPPSGFQFDLYLLYQARRAGLDILTVPVIFGQRAHGQSKWSTTIFSRYRTISAMLLYIFKMRFGRA